jgi:hypothetical protein
MDLPNARTDGGLAFALERGSRSLTPLVTAISHNVTQPYLSVVVTTRNDDHGGNPLGRTQAFINGLIGQCRRHKLQAELIIVEWNPPTDRPPLADVLDWPDDREFCKVRIIEVPLEIHQRMRHWEAMPLYQMIAKNVGIRRAHGEYVLATNIDILFSDELMRFIAGKRLEQGKMYRVDRWDVMAEVPVNAPVEEQLAYCESHLIRQNAREGTFRLSPDGSRQMEANDIASLDGPVKLGTGWFHRELSGDEPFRWIENEAELVISTARGEVSNLSQVLVLDVEPGPGVGMSSFLLELRDDSGKQVSEIRVKRRSVITFTLPKSEAETLRVFLYTRDGGNRIHEDLRTLNFRVFSCKIKTTSGSGSTVAVIAESPTAKLNVPVTWGARIGRGLRIARELWRGNSNVQLRIPMSQQQLDQLQLKQDGSGVSFSASVLKRRRRGAEVEGIVPPGMRAMWSSGWHSLEHFGGESFRWMEERSVVLWIPPQELPAQLALHVEPGPALGFRPCQLEIRDQWGEVIGVHEVSGRTAIRIPVAHLSGPFITSFEVLGGGPPQPIADDRKLALKLRGCSWEGAEGYQPDSSASELVDAGQGVWIGRGWRASNDREEPKGLAALRDAELILRVPDGPDRLLTLSVAPGSGSEDLDLLIEDAAGQIVYRGIVTELRQIPLKKVFRAGSFYTLRLRDAARDESTRSKDPTLFIPDIQWNDAHTGGDCVRIVLRRAPPDQAVQLHTNACGDFTLMAIDHWMELRAYPELDLFSMNIDSIFCWMAHHGGAREETLEDPMRIYHIEHGSGWTPEGEKKLFDRIAAKGIPWVDFREVAEWGRLMNRFDAPMIFNRADWGFAKDALKETEPRGCKR